MWEQIKEIIELPEIKLADIMAEIILVLIGLILLFFIIICIRDVNRFIIREYYFCAAELKKNAKILLITDLHNKKYGRNNLLLWNAVETLAPDYVLIGGDMITAGKGDNTVAIEFLRLLSQKYPVFYGNGNHETKLLLNAEKYAPMAMEYENALAEMPLKRLRNEHVYIKELNMNIYGLDMEREYYKRFKRKHMDVSYLNECLGEAAKGAVNLLIAHNPEYFRNYVEWGADLVVSGHMHGGIVKLPAAGGVISPRFTLFPEFDGGFYSEGRARMALSRGIGSHNLPLRIFNPGELVVIHVRH